MPAHVQRLLGRYEHPNANHETYPQSAVSLLGGGPQEETSLFPAGLLDQDLQQLDLRGRNSWRLLLAEVSSVELLEVHLVNAIAPFILNARLKPLIRKTQPYSKKIAHRGIWVEPSLLAEIEYRGEIC